MFDFPDLYNFLQLHLRRHFTHSKYQVFIVVPQLIVLQKNEAIWPRCSPIKELHFADFTTFFVCR
ncbi:MAG TPA: hypothetical protein DDX75_12005 [Phycisphaerales bacterium]|nr:hypothetical protein [Phycisphaerales bacterium]